MALSLSSRRQAQTSAAAWSGQQEAVQASLQARSRHLRLQKQHSFAEVSRANVGTVSSRNGRAAYLTRGLSVDRSCESLRQRIFTPKANRTGQHLRRTNSKLKDSSTFSALRKSSIDGTSSYVLTGATSTLLKSLDGKLKQVNSVLGGRNNGSSGAAADSKTKGSDTASQIQQPHLATTSDTNHSKTPCSKEALKSDASRINLNIVLLHAIKTSTENEAINSEIESCSEAADTITIPASRSEHSTKLNAAPAATAQQRRAQFRSSRSTTINVSSSALPPLPPQVPAATVESTAANGGFSASPSLIVQRRPPLVRAMSAPVRSRPLDENSKGVLALNKRKLRRRKLLPRNASVCENSENAADDSRSDLILDIGGSRKKTPLARARSTIAVDVITLVSLVSSEGSDSEKEDSASTTPTGHSEPNSGRPSSLRKTGKSVSFQENYPPNFQLATKEYSHMIRRGSIAPLAARLRANRPPTAPPVSIFLNDSTDIDAMTTPTGKKASNSSTQPAEECKDAAQSDKENTSADLSSKPEEYTFPEYVRSIKERECWKLYRKMSVKGVNVTYDTILRGMLTPTEFRQVQKRRDLEEAKARALEEEKLAAEIPPPRISALERITQAHTKK